jgi:hypothetical protein
MTSGDTPAVGQKQNICRTEDSAWFNINRPKIDQAMRHPIKLIVEKGKV